MKLVVSIAFILFCMTAQSQFYPQFNSYMFNGLAINPAYAGSRDALSISALHNSQWTGLDGAPTTQILSLHSPIKNRHHALSGMITRDKIGVQSMTSVFPGYAYHLQTGKKHFLSFGLSAGISILNSEWTAVQTVDEADQSFSQNSNNMILPNVSAGLFFYSENGFVGVSAPFIFKHQFVGDQVNTSASFDLYQQSFLLNTGLILFKNSNLVWKPSVLLKALPNRHVQLDINSHFFISNLINLGISYRTRDALVAQLGVRLNKNFDLGYAYAHPASRLSNYARGTHEFMLRYEFKYEVKLKNSRYF